MTQDEVDLIYDYLHENYRYEDGELVCKKGRFGKKEGSKLGSVSYGDELTAPCIKSIISINKKRFASTLAQFVFIYHNKKYTPYFKYIDGNKMNTRLENIEPTDVKNVYLQKFKNARGFTPIVDKSGVKYRALLRTEYKSYFLGNYNTEEQAYKVWSYSKELLSQGITDLFNIKKELMKEFYFCNFKINANKCGFPNLIKSFNRYCYRIRAKGKNIVSKSYDTPEEAHAAYLKAKEEYAKNA